MKIKVNAYWCKYSWESDFRIGVSEYDLESTNSCVYIKAGEFEVDLDVIPLSHADAVLAQVTMLRQEAGKHQAAITDIKARINELMCIEHKEES